VNIDVEIDGELPKRGIFAVGRVFLTSVTGDAPAALPADVSESSSRPRLP
jgi:hypothetical protein